MKDDECNEADLRWRRNISGLVMPPELKTGYRIVTLPHRCTGHIDVNRSSATSQPGEDVQLPANPNLEISQSSNMAATFVALKQLSYAGYKLGRGTGDGFERYGYSAYVLTVVPVLDDVIRKLGGEPRDVDLPRYLPHRHTRHGRSATSRLRLRRSYWLYQSRKSVESGRSRAARLYRNALPRSR
jgi:hypothetical protein